MTNDLKTKIAEAMHAIHDEHSTIEELAQAALQAIHDAGFAVVPREHPRLLTPASALIALHEAKRADESALQASQPKTEKT